MAKGWGLDAKATLVHTPRAAGLDPVTESGVDRSRPENPVTPERQEGRRAVDVSAQLAVLASRVRARLLFMVLDAVCVVAAYSAAEVFYWRHVAPTEYGWHFAIFVLIVVVVTLICNRIYGLYGRMWQHAGLEEARQMIFSTVTVAAVLVILYPLIRLAGYQLVHPGVVLIGLILATAGHVPHPLPFAHLRLADAVREVTDSGWRSSGAVAPPRPPSARCCARPDTGLIPVAVFDDDTSVHGKSLVGVPVVGSIRDIPSATSRYQLQEVLLAIPDASPEMIAEVLHSAEAAGIAMKVLPTMSEVLHGPSAMLAIRRARQPSIEDLLGRTPVATDLDGVRQSLQGHRVLVTGAGGSIGSEICRQVAGFNPEVLVLLDHDETHLHDTMSTVDGPCHQALVDINDRDALFDLFERYRPDVVLHAAAHKHVPVLEDHPVEAAADQRLRNPERDRGFGCRGGEPVLADLFRQGRDALECHGSDQEGRRTGAVESIDVRTAPTARSGSATCWGVGGASFPTFARQIAAGGPVTVTDPRMTRFFMSVEEAVQLVLQASLLSEGRDIFMLEMGEPVPIIDLARRMIQLSGSQVDVDVKIKVVGIRPGEKLEEDLRESDEEVISTEHPSISRLLPVTAPKAWFDSCLGQLAEATQRGDADTVRRLLFTIAGSALYGDISAPAALAKGANGDHSVPFSAAHHRHGSSDFKPEPAGT